jgi:hypothetical protein
MKIKLKWRVREAPTGRYRSFEKRSWPDAEYSNGDPAFCIRCKTQYIPARVKTGDHLPLKLLVADWSIDRKDGRASFEWRRFKAEFKTIPEAKKAALEFINKHPEMMPKGVKE